MQKNNFHALIHGECESEFAEFLAIFVLLRPSVMLLAFEFLYSRRKKRDVYKNTINIIQNLTIPRNKLSFFVMFFD